MELRFSFLHEISAIKETAHRFFLFRLTSTVHTIHKQLLIRQLMMRKFKWNAENDPET